jgi:hypothetical protein
MGDDGKKLVDAWPWDGPWRVAFGQFGYTRNRPAVKWGFFAMGIDEYVRIHSDHSPCPS